MNEHITLSIFGLANANGCVRADVLAQKLTKLLDGLKEVDKNENGKESHHYLVTELKFGSAVLKIEQHPIYQKLAVSPIHTLHNNLEAIYKNEKQALNFTDKFLNTASFLPKGANENHDFCEISFYDEKSIRIDDFFQRRVETILKLRKELSEAQHFKNFEGVAVSSFEGKLTILDKGQNSNNSKTWRAMLKTTIGDKQIECIIKKNIALTAFSTENRLRVTGLCHYFATSALPVRMDILKFEEISKPRADQSLRGAFQFDKFEMSEAW